MWKNVRIRTRLFIGFGILLILFIITGWFSLRMLENTAAITTKIYNHPFIVSNASRDIHTYIIKIQRGVRDAILSTGGMQLNEALNFINENELLVLEKLDILKERFLGDKKLLEQFDVNFKNWRPMREITLNLAREGKKAEAAAINKQKDTPYVAGLANEIKNIIDFSEKKAQEFMSMAQSYEKKTIIVVVLMTLAAVVIAFITGFTITMSITRPLHDAVDVAKHLALNDISLDIKTTGSTDEPSVLLQSMKEMLDNLRQQIGDIMSGINVIASSAAQISATTTQLAASFNEIAAAISQTVTSMREVKQTSELSSEKATYVSESARNVVQVSRSGEKAVSETITVMNDIREQMVAIAEGVLGLSERSQSIGEIITLLDDISVKARLLAVNASIEAVKAGEHGKGFSVVASELKNMVSESKQYTNQVRTILTEIQKAMGNSVMVTEKGHKTVDNGVKQTTRTGEAIQALGQSIQESSQAALQIEATVRQQMAGIEQVFSAMENINSAIIQNNEGARQLENAARNLDELGRKLKTLIQNYKL